LKNLISIIQKHIRLNIPIYFIALLFFTIGIVTGTYTIKALPGPQKVELMDYLEGFFQILKNQDIDSYQLLFQSLLNNLKLFIPIWILGLTIIGTPIILVLLGFRGFVLGFTLGFVIDKLALKGVLFIVLSILPHNIFYIPGLIGIGVMAISFSLFIFKSRIKKQKIHNRKAQIWTYTIAMMLISTLLILGSIVEAYITPIFMKVLFTI
jgi:stage II sporulation protein M